MAFSSFCLPSIGKFSSLETSNHTEKGSHVKSIQSEGFWKMQFLTSLLYAPDPKPLLLYIILKLLNIALYSLVIVKVMVFPVVTYSCESWTVKKAECWRLYAFKLWCWRRLLQVPWTVKRSNQSILREINPEYTLEGLMLKSKLQYFGHLMWTADSLEKSLVLGKI